MSIHGGMGREERRKAQEAFTQDKDVLVLVATDAAGEGINLQRAHLMVNYDLPWNPNRIEQRFGRVHRIGQTEVCHLWNLVAEDTREGQVFQRLFEKLEEQRQALGDQVFDVLGESFRGKSLRDLLIEASATARNRLPRPSCARLSMPQSATRLRAVVHERALVHDVMTIADVERIRDEMERAEARKLQPHFIRAFFLEAFALLGGSVASSASPDASRSLMFRPSYDVGIGRSVSAHLSCGATSAVTFDKHLIAVEGSPLAEYLTPGTPAARRHHRSHHRASRRGCSGKVTVLVDESDPGETPRAPRLPPARGAVDGRTIASGAPPRRLQAL